MAKKTILSLALFIVISTLVILFLPKLPDRTIEIFSIIGSIASLFGLFHVWQQILESIEISEATKKAADDAKSHVLDLICVIDLIKLRKTIQETMAYNRANKFELSLLRMPELRESLSLISSNIKYTSIVSKKILVDHITNISVNINTIEKKINNSDVVLDVNCLNKDLDDLLSCLDKLISKIRFLEEEK